MTRDNATLAFVLVCLSSVQNFIIDLKLTFEWVIFLSIVHNWMAGKQTEWKPRLLDYKVKHQVSLLVLHLENLFETKAWKKIIMDPHLNTK